MHFDFAQYKQKGFAGALILIGILIVFLGIVGAWYTKLIQIPGFAPPGCDYQKVQCIMAPCNPVLVCETPSVSPIVTPKPSVTPSTFNLIFRYGGSELNTFSKKFTQDMVIDPPVTVDFVLSDEELNMIHQKINELKLFDKDSIKESSRSGSAVIPCGSYYLKVQIDSDQKELSWDDCRGIDDKLQQFKDFILSIITTKEEYKKLPALRGFYL